jgi:sulfite exporter TauE/SafE
MCGAFAAFAAMPRADGSGGGLRLHVAYNGSRLVVYSILGGLAGLLGAALDVGGSVLGIQHIAGIAAGALLVGAGLVAALRLLGVRIPSLAAAPLIGQWIRKGHARALGWPPLLRALAVGLLTALLPCGWLWAFVVAAAGTGHPLLGALTLAVFWVGTVPVLAAIGAGFQRFAGLVGLRAQLVACLAVIMLGVVSVVGRWNLPVLTQRMAGTPASEEEAVECVESLRGAHPPGCKHGP